MTKIRGKYHRQVLQERLREEEQQRSVAAQFQAQPIPQVKPFVPKRSDRPTTENEPISLNTEFRAEQRKCFDQEMEERERQLKLAKERKEMEEVSRMKEEIRRLRQEAQFRAQPLKHVVPFEPKKSSKILTEPVSPFIGEKRRQAMKKL